MENRFLLIIEVHGSHREMGRQIGEACRQKIQHSIENAHTLISATWDKLGLTWESSRTQARKYIPFAEEIYPQYIEEMHGYAEGANVLYDDIVVLNAMEAVTNDALHLTKCTSMAVNQARSANGHVLVAHNEDWVPEDEPDAFLILARPEHELPYLAMTYGGLLPNIGMNAAGVCQCCDSVYPTDSRIGIPRILVSRAVLNARIPSEAIRYTLVPHRAAGYNHLIAHESGELYSVEVTARKFALLYGMEGYMVHTNHFLDAQMQTVEYEPDELISTRVRYFRALRLLRQTQHHTVRSLQAILKDHVNYPDSICNHDVEGDALDREKTINSLVFDLTNRQLHAAWGNPCKAAFHTYQLP